MASPAAAECGSGVDFRVPSLHLHRMIPGLPREADPTVQPLRVAASRVVRLLVPIAILALLWFVVDGPDALRRLARADPRWLLAALAAAHLQIVVSALRWKLTAAQLEQTIPTRTAIVEYYLSQFLNHTLPSGVLGDAGRAMRMRHQAGMMRATQGVFIERAAAQIALLAIMFCGFAFESVLPEAVDWPRWVVRIALMLGAGAAALIVTTLIMRHVPGVVSRAARGFVTAALQALARPGVWPWQLLLSFTSAGLTIAIFAFCAAATGTDLPFAALVSAVPLILLAMLVPVSIGGWGLREGAAAALFPLLRAPAEAGIAASIAFGLVLLAASLPGAVTMMRARRRK